MDDDTSLPLPTRREIELETALRKRDTQVVELMSEIGQLRQYLATHTPQPSLTDPISLPPNVVSMLLPHISKVVSPSGSSSASNSSTVNTALTHRIRVLQEENDELYEVLRHGETGKLKEEVRGLRQVVGRLEGALRESHQVITTLSNELDKSYQTFYSSVRPKPHPNAHAHPYAPPPAPRDTFHQHQHHQNTQHHPYGPSVSNGLSKLPPTGPRAHKKPRLAPEANFKVSPAHSSASLPPSSSNPVSSTKHPPSQGQGQGQTQPAPIKNEPSRSPRIPPSESRHKGSMKMEIEEDSRTRPRLSQERDRERHRDKDRGRERERGRDRDREKDRDRERERFSKRNGTVSSGGGGRGRSRGGFSHPYAGGDRTLAERMGL